MKKVCQRLFKLQSSLSLIIIILILNVLSGCGDLNKEDFIKADFFVDNRAIETGDAVTFTDISTNSPTSWAWTFEGGTPTSATTQNPSVTYNTAGTYNVVLTTTNADGSDTETKTGYIDVRENNNTNKAIIGYWECWNITRLRLKDISDKYNVINVAFGVPI